MDTITLSKPHVTVSPPWISERPYLAQVETTSICNAKCLMCPRDQATRSDHKNLMDESVFKSAVKQLVEDLGVKIILPFIDGEPLADKRMVDFVEWMARAYPKLECGWYSNGSLLSEERAYRLLRAGNIKHFNISMQGGNKETYEKVMGLPWERTIENVERLIEINRQLGHPVQIRANMCVFSPTQPSVDDFRARWGKFEDVKICLGAFSNFGGLGSDEAGEAPWRGVTRNICDRGTKHVYIAWNGDCIQCCFDLIGSGFYGNIKESRLLDLWNSEKARAARHAHWELRVKDMPKICQACNAPRFHG